MGLPVPLPDLLSITETLTSHLDREEWVVVGSCAMLAPIVTSSRDPKNKELQVVSL